MLPASKRVAMQRCMDIPSSAIGPDARGTHPKMD
jgi:hypothetical protein